jgi:hypothetical protein
MDDEGLGGWQDLGNLKTGTHPRAGLIVVVIPSGRSATESTRRGQS